MTSCAFRYNVIWRQITPKDAKRCQKMPNNAKRRQIMSYDVIYNGIYDVIWRWIWCLRTANAYDVIRLYAVICLELYDVLKNWEYTTSYRIFSYIRLPLLRWQAEGIPLCIPRRHRAIYQRVTFLKSIFRLKFYKIGENSDHNNMDPSTQYCIFPVSPFGFLWL
jgi:hypothetical protein